MAVALVMWVSQMRTFAWIFIGAGLTGALCWAPGGAEAFPVRVRLLRAADS
jgi:hypothetical protein